MIGRLPVVTACLIAIAVASAASTTLAASEPRDAKSIALRLSDLPASARRMSEKESRSASLPGGTGQAYSTTFQIPLGERTVAVGTIVITAPNVDVARRVYVSAVGDARRTAVGALRLPVLGTEQSAALYGRPALDEASAAVWVRTGAVVWQVQVSSVRNPFGFTRAEARSELLKVARKQQRRVGAG